MKPINEMNLLECLAFLQNNGENGPDGIFYTDALGLQGVIKRIHEITRWIPLGERMPTQDDADVLLMYDGGFIEYRPWGFADKESHTHWKRIDKP